MKLLSSLSALMFLISSHAAFGWGQTGHRVTGAIAEQHLTPEAKSAIEALLPNESLAEASTYADEMRSNPSEFWQKTASPWHYVTIPSGKTYTQVGAPVKGDAVTALSTFRQTLLDERASVEEKQLALRFIVHLVGDLHQPFHTGNGRDRGGNDVNVTFMNQPTNLHRVWDTSIVNYRELSYSEWANWLSAKITPQQAGEWDEANPLVWIAESAKIRDTIYPENENLSWDYIYVSMPVVKRRLQQAGIRIAAYLNQIFTE